VPKRTIYDVDTLTGFFQTYLLDSLLPFEPNFVVPLHSRKKQDLQVTFTATGREKFILIGNFMSDEASSIQHRFFGNPDKGPWFLEVERVSLNGTEHPECECSRQEEIVDLLNRRHSFFGKCEDSIPVDMNHLFQGVPQWDQRYAEETSPAPALPFETGKSYRIDRIYFEFDSAVLLPSSFPALDSLAILLNTFTAYDVEIHGHTDSLGSAEYNRVLSDRRAAAVRSYLIEQGVDPYRLNSMGYGSSRPLADNSTPEGRQENRRVEFILLEAAPTHTH
jgi:outer membrane protein OmpA-like peptidoglycan-associated protein